MRNLEPLIAEINLILDSVEIPPKNQLQRIAKWYTDEVDYLNDELHKTQSLLDRGKKRKALQLLLNGDSSLRETYQLLDFDRKDEWTQFCIRQKLATPSKIDCQTLGALESTLEDFAPIESLLDRLRILILGGAPAFSRHAILRLLCRRDPANPIWMEDLLNLERYRIENLPAEIAKAREQFDRQRLIELAEEIESIEWQSTVPPELLSFLKDSKQKHFGTGILFELNELTNKMLSLFEARKWDEANLVKKEWDALYRKTDDELKESISRELNDVFDWTKQTTSTNENDTSKSIAGSSSPQSKRHSSASMLAPWIWLLFGTGAGSLLLWLLYWLFN